MNVGDPVQSQTWPRMPRGRKACACGCLLGGPLLLALLFAAAGWVIRGEPLPIVRPDTALARQLQTKLDVLRKYSDPRRAFLGELLPTTELTQSELNAFAAVSRTQLQSPAREALEALYLELADGHFVLRARLNLDALAEATIPYLPLPDELGVRIDVTGLLGWVDGRGKLEIRSAQIGALSLSGDTTLWLIQKLYPPAEAWFEVMKGFPLPFGTKDLKVEKGRVLLTGS